MSRLLNALSGPKLICDSKSKMANDEKYSLNKIGVSGPLYKAHQRLDLAQDLHIGIRNENLRGDCMYPSHVSTLKGICSYMVYDDPVLESLNSCPASYSKSNSSGSCSHSECPKSGDITRCHEDFSIVAQFK